MKINIVVPFKRLAGGIKVIFTYANHLVQAGHDVAVYMPMVSYRVKGQNLPRQIKASISNALKPEHWIDYQFQFHKVPLIRERFIRDADVIIATSWPTAYDVQRLSASKGKKVYFVQGYEIFSGDAAVVDPTYQMGMHTIVITKQLSQLLKERFGVNSTVIYNGLESTEFLCGEKPTEHSPSVMLLYHEDAYKGTAEALAIAERLRENHPGLHINMFGRRVTKEFPPHICVLSDPCREKLMEMYRNADIYLFTSTQEGWGLPILEAMSNKCAVVGFRLGAMAEIVDGTNAWAVDVGDVDGVYEAANKLLLNRADLCAMQEQAYQTALNFSWEKSCAAFERELIRINSSNQDRK